MKKLLIISAVCYAIFAALPAFAQISLPVSSAPTIQQAANNALNQCPKNAPGCTKLIVPLPGILGPVTTVTGPAQYILAVFQFAITVGGLLAMAVIIYAAIERMFLAVGNPARVADADNKIYNALWGLVLLFAAFVILNTINPNLVNLKNPSLQQVSGSGSLADQLAGVNAANLAIGQAVDTLGQANNDLQNAQKSGDPVAIANAQVEQAEAQVLVDQAQIQTIQQRIAYDSNLCQNYDQLLAQKDPNIVQSGATRSKSSVCNDWNTDKQQLTTVQARLQSDQQALDAARENLSHLTA